MFKLNCIILNSSDPPEKIKRAMARTLRVGQVLGILTGGNVPFYRHYVKHLADNLKDTNYIVNFLKEFVQWHNDMHSTSYTLLIQVN